MEFSVRSVRSVLGVTLIASTLHVPRTLDGELANFFLAFNIVKSW